MDRVESAYDLRQPVIIACDPQTSLTEVSSGPVGTENATSPRLRRSGWWAYQVGMAGALALAGPVLLARRGSHYLSTLSGRLGGWAGSRPPRRGGLWIHAVSVGEVAVAATLARALPGDQPAVVTTVTPTGQERARSAFGGRSSVAYLPFDLGWPVRRFFRRFAPEALILVEGDYWPLLLREAGRRGLPVAVVNGRVGDKSFRRMRRLRRLLGPLLGGVGRFGVQTSADALRLEELGVAPARITVTGNLKYDSPAPAPLPELEDRLRELAAGRPLLVAGSTMAGEEERVLEAHRGAGGGTRALLLLAPRHPERWDEVAALVEGRGLRLVRRSRLPGERLTPEPDSPPPTPPDAVLLDSLGELSAVYGLAAAAFIGGTLVPTGGHNPLEAARWAVPVAVGPSMENFREVAEEFDRRRAWARAADGAELGRTWRRWLDDPAAARAVGERGRELVAANRGAVAKTVAMLQPILDRVVG